MPDEMCAVIAGNTFNLTCWSDETSCTCSGGRMDQSSLHEFLHRVADTRHSGMRKGNLALPWRHGLLGALHGRGGELGASRRRTGTTRLGYMSESSSPAAHALRKHFVHTLRTVPVSLGKKATASAPKMMTYITFRNRGVL